MRLLRTTALTLLLGAGVVPIGSLAAQAQIVMTVGVPPPPLPVYLQPPIPEPGYIWTPGYWAFDDDYGYYWVPGTWVEAPRPGLLWTPGYWGYNEGHYGYHDGYWGDEVGYYGGVDYGYGYGGQGYGGGYWTGGHFFYNRTVNNFGGVQITNLYNKTVINEGGSHVSYNGGQGGLTARPTQQQQAFASQQHVQPTSVQRQHVQLAQKDPSLRESTNKGRPPVAATSRPTAFKGEGVVPAKSAGVRPAGQEIPHGKTAPNDTTPKPQDHALPTPGAPSKTTPKTVDHTLTTPKSTAPKSIAPKPAAEGAPHSTPQHELKMQTHATPQHEPRPDAHAAPPPTHQPKMETHAAPPVAHEPRVQAEPHMQARPEARTPAGGGGHPGGGGIPGGGGHPGGGGGHPPAGGGGHPAAGGEHHDPH